MQSHFSSIFSYPRTQVRIPFPVSGKTVSPLSGPDPVPLTPRRLFFKTVQRDAQRVLRHTQVWLRFYMACATGHVMSWNSSTNTANDLMVVRSCFPYCRLAYPRKESTPLYFRLYTSFFLYVRLVSGRRSLFSISSRIAVKSRRQPRLVLFRAIEMLLNKWPHHTVLIPTSRALATLTATSPQRENLELRSYYKIPSGPYISHIRIHKDITVEDKEGQTIMGDILPKLRLDSNPFEPAATGAPLCGQAFTSRSTSPQDEEHLLDLHQTGRGVKAIVIVGEYGTGKTCLLQWLHNEVFPEPPNQIVLLPRPGRTILRTCK